MEMPIYQAMDTTENWNNSGTALGESELAIEVTPEGTKQLLIGDGLPVSGGINRLRAQPSLIAGLDTTLESLRESEASYAQQLAGDAPSGLYNMIETEKETRAQEDNRLQEGIDLEKEARSEAVGSLQEAIDQEETARLDKESETAKKFDGELQTGLLERIGAEKEDRMVVEAALAGQLAGTTDSGLKALISAEEGSRITSDEALEETAADLQEQIDEHEARINGLRGQGGYLTANDFGTDTPTDDDLTAYAMSQIPTITDPLDIWNGTKVKNLFNEHVWVLNNTPNTVPPVFEWSDDGTDMVAIATNSAAGIVKGSADAGKVSVNATTGEMTANGLAEAAAAITAVEAQIAGTSDSGLKTLIAQEAQAREAGENVWALGLSVEESNRIEGDSEAADNLNNEINARINGDNALQNLINTDAAVLTDATATDALLAAGTRSKTAWLQGFRNNIKSLQMKTVAWLNLITNPSAAALKCALNVPRITCVVDSDEKLYDWGYETAVYDCSWVHVKKGTWSFGCPSDKLHIIDCLICGTKCITGEEGAILDFNINNTSTSTFYGIYTTASAPYTVENLHIKMHSSSSKTLHCFYNAASVSNCTAEITEGSVGRGFYNCENLYRCIANIDGSGSAYSFNLCTKLAFCTAKIKSGTSKKYG